MGKAITNLAGIIPVSNYKSDLNLPYHDCLLPVAKDITAIESAVYNCLQAGCRTIWIVCEDDTKPIIRDIIGDYVTRESTALAVPVFYTPCNPKHWKKKDSYAYSVIQGAKTAVSVSRAYSDWTSPNKFFISFPMCVVDQVKLLEFRKKKYFSIPFKNTIIESSDGDTFLKNKLFPFCVTTESINQCNYYVQIASNTSRELIPGMKIPADFNLTDYKMQDYYQGSKVKNTAAKFQLSDVFMPVSTDPSLRANLECYDISNWDGYKNYLSKEGERLISPNFKLQKVEIKNNWKYEGINYAEEIERII